MNRRRLQALTAAFLLVPGVAAASEETVVRLIQACVLNPDARGESLATCAAACFGAMETVGQLAGSFYFKASLALWVTAGLMAILLATAFIAVQRMGMKAGWSNLKLVGTKAALAVAVGALGFGIQLVAFDMLARPPLRAIYASACDLVSSGAADPQGDQARSTCSNTELIAKATEVEQTLPAVGQPFSKYAGVYNRFAPGLASFATHSVEVEARFKDMGAFLADAAKLDKINDCGRVDAIDGKGPYAQLMAHVPFPGSFWLAALIGIAAGWVISFLARVARR